METQYQLINVAYPDYWLTKRDLRACIADLPASFDQSEQQIGPIIRRVVEGWLVNLIGAKQVVELNSAGEIDYDVSEPYDDTKRKRLALRSFLANAVWSQYLLVGGISYSDTGPVQKSPDTIVEPISDRRRAELIRFYKDEAERYALVLTELYAPDSCGSARRSGSSSIRSAGGRRRSRF